MDSISDLIKDREIKRLKEKEELDSFLKENPKPTVTTCLIHTGELTTDYEANKVGVAYEWTQTKWECPKCREKKELNQQFEANLASADIPERYKDVPIGTNYHQTLREGLGILFMGGVGTGKTYQLIAAIKYLISQGNIVKFMTFGELTRQIRDSIGNNQYNELYTKLLNRNILIIDDLGVENTTPFIKEFIYNIVNDFYNNKKILLITTNLTGEEIIENYSQRVASRLKEMCMVVKLDGEDKRNN